MDAYCLRHRVANEMSKDGLTGSDDRNESKGRNLIDVGLERFRQRAEEEGVQLTDVDEELFKLLLLATIATDKFVTPELVAETNQQAQAVHNLPKGPP